MKLSIVIPAYNEERRIEKTLTSYVNYFGPKFGKDYEIIVVCDGCKDNTPGIVKDFSGRHPVVRFTVPPNKLGKGGGVLKGFELAKGDVIGFVDADDAFNIDGVGKLVSLVQEGSDAAIASKWIGRNFFEVTEPFFRKIASRGWNLILHVLFGLTVRDAQAGAKFFKREVVKGLPPIRCKGFEFDAELLWRITQKGYSIKELYIPTTHVDGSTFKMSQSMNMLINILKLRFDIL